MNLRHFILCTLTTSSLFLASFGVAAGTVVTEKNNGDLMVVEFKGKPPHKRRVISTNDTADYARFEEYSESVLVATNADRRSGPAGKSLPAQQARIERVPLSEITQFARFEETENSSSSNTRLWRGAPGKGRPNLSR